MRDRLIKLLQEFADGTYSSNGYIVDNTQVDDVADHLLANGVIVPPCKVGTTLYFLYNSPYADKPDLTPRIYKTTDWYFEVDKTGIVICTSDIHSFNKKYDYFLEKRCF